MEYEIEPLEAPCHKCGGTAVCVIWNLPCCLECIEATEDMIEAKQWPPPTRVYKVRAILPEGGGAAALNIQAVSIDEAKTQAEKTFPMGSRISSVVLMGGAQ